MAMFPYFYEPPALFDQHFGHGMDMEDLMNSMMMNPVSRHYYRPWRSLSRAASRMDSGSKISLDKDKYQVCLDVQQFAPNEVTVKTVGQQVVVEGKHEEKQDEHGYISRHFVRKYQLPEGIRAEDVVSSLSSDGVLTVTAPRNQPAIKEGERVVPITQTGPAHTKISKAEPKKDEQTMEQ